MERKPRILIVDSETDFRARAQSALEGVYELTFASSREDALAKVKHGSPDLIVVGYIEPRGNAYRLHKDLRGEMATMNIPLVVVDVRPEEHLRKGWRRDEGMQMDAEEYISRPIEPSEFKATVGKVLQKASGMPMDIKQVLRQMEDTLEEIDKVEKLLVKR